MRYVAYGRDIITKEPREPLSLEAETEDGALKQAAELGMEVYSVERPDDAGAPLAKSTFAGTRTLVTVFRGLAIVCGVLALFMTLAASGATGVLSSLLTGVLTISLLLAVAAALNLGIAIEKNTRAS